MTSNICTFVLRFVMWHMQQHTATFVSGWCANCYSNSFSASVVCRSTNQDGELFMLILILIFIFTFHRSKLGYINHKDIEIQRQLIIHIKNSVIILVAT